MWGPPTRSSTGVAVEELDANDPREIGPYELLGILGAGGMGRVYLGQDAAGGRAAVKVVHSDLAREPEFRRRFQREIAALRTVSGPGIAAILDADAEAERPWLATEYVEGPSLWDVVTKGPGTLDEAAVRTLGAALARTLAVIHAAKLVHRDIKPTNLLLSEDGPKLIDFGIARDLAASTITRTGLAVGTPQYMAPEQLESGRRTATAADVFALAGVLVFAATGRGPFGEGTPAQLLYAIVHSEPELGEVPAGLRSVLLRCLEKDPAKRPTAARVAQELGEVGGGAGVAETVRLDDGVRRSRGRRVGLVGAVAVALAVVVGAGVVLVEGNANGSSGANGSKGANGGGHSGEGGGFPSGVGGTSSSGSSAGGGSGASSSGGGSNGGGSGGGVLSGGSGTTSGSAPVSGSPGSGSPTGTRGGGSGGGWGGGTRGGGSGGSGPITSHQSSGSHGGTVGPPTTSSSSRTAPPPSTSRGSSAPPPGSAPGSVTGVAVRPDSVDGGTMAVSWNADSGASSYVVKYAEQYVPGNPTSVTATGTSTTISTIPYQPYCVQVQAVNSYGVSGWSGQVCVQAAPGG